VIIRKSVNHVIAFHCFLFVCEGVRLLFCLTDSHLRRAKTDKLRKGIMLHRGGELRQC
jgi:hypothetical protein